MGRPSKINRASVLAEALALADDQGLDAVTMATLARRLGVTPMALYRHVTSKADVLDGLVELLLAEALSTTGRELPGLERLTGFAHQLRATAQRHPAAFSLLMQRPAAAARAREIRDTISRALIDAGIQPDRADQLQRLLSTAVLGFGLSEISGRFDNQTPAQRDLDFDLLLELLTHAVQSQLPHDTTSHTSRDSDP